MRLIYLNVCEDELFSDIGVNFTDDYLVSVVDKSQIIIKKNECFNKNSIYGEKIDNITAIVGKNGTGKTTLLNFLGMQDNEVFHYYPKASYCILYEENDNLYIEIKQGERCINFLVEEPEEKIRNWWVIKYDKKNKKINCSFDLKWGNMIPHLNKICEKVFYLYYKDNSANQTGWTRTCGFDYDGNLSESNINRINIHNFIYDIYYFMIKKRDMLNKILKKREDVGGILILNHANNKTIIWESCERGDFAKTFIIQMLFNICMQKNKDENDFEQINRKLIKDDLENLPKIEDYEYYKNTLKKIFLDKYSYHKKELYSLIESLENIDAKYFQKRGNYFVKKGCISSEVIKFSLSNKFDFDFYTMLKKISEFNDDFSNYNLFVYQYDYMSAGEAKSIDIFSGVYQIINRNIGLKDKKLILLLDEPDKGMHPELTRKFISILNDFSEEIGNKYRCKFQYIISTHSPFLILDVPETNVYRMDIKNEKIVLKRGNKGIMSNVVDLIKDDFFLESVFGELSEKYFKEVQKEIKDSNVLTDIEELKSKIEFINEPCLKDYLYERLEKKLEEKYSKESLIQYYKRKIRELEKND